MKSLTSSFMEAGNEPKGNHTLPPVPKKLLNYTTFLEKGGN